MPRARHRKLRWRPCGWTTATSPGLRENTSKLIAEDPPGAVRPRGHTSPAPAALPLATAAKVPFFAPFTGARPAPALQPLRPPARLLVNDETSTIAHHPGLGSIKKIAVFHQNDAYARRPALDGVELALGAQNMKPVAKATVERNSVDVAAAVKTLLAAAPDAIVQISAYKSCAAFIRAAKAAGFGGTFFNVSSARRRWPTNWVQRGRGGVVRAVALQRGAAHHRERGRRARPAANYTRPTSPA